MQKIIVGLMALVFGMSVAVAADAVVAPAKAPVAKAKKVKKAKVNHAKAPAVAKAPAAK